MKPEVRASLAVALCEFLVILPGCASRPSTPPTVPLTPAVFQPLQVELQKHYLTLFEIAPQLEFSPTQIAQMRDYLHHAQEYCTGQFKNRSDQLNAQINQTQDELKKQNGHLTDAQRHSLHCTIQNLAALKSQAEVLANHAIPTAYDNKQAKLDLIQQWPAQRKQIEAQLGDGSYRNRRWGDVQNIGFRVIAANQQDDIKTGEDAVKQMRASGLMPRPIQNQAVADYVNALGQKIAAHSDLHIPLHVTVLDSKEINAFALPGGFLFIQRGLLDAVDDESELAGVMGHEIAHDVARHGHKLMQKATIESILFGAAEIAAIVLTGGVAGIGAYYAIQYGFYGLGLILDLQLLGVSREYELEADQLGIQYTWNSGYDPTGFIRFFDKMATDEGYVNGVGWFHDHPPFYQRMVDAMREIMFLPPKPNPIRNSAAFEQMKSELAKVKAQVVEEEKGRPSLLAPEQGCPAPQKYEYTPGQPIEDLCKLPGP